MKPLFKYLLIISSLGFGSLTFFGFIAYQNSVSIGIFKQHDLLIELTHQMLTTKPKVNTPATLSAWLNNDKFISGSIFTILIRDENNQLIASKSGYSSKVDISYISNLKTPSLNSTETDFLTHKNLRYIWHEDTIDNSPYTFILYYASKPNEQSFYFDYMALPLIISAFITFWVSLWGALVLSNLFKRIEEQKKLMEHNSLHDTLTGLPNRALFSDRLNHAFSIAKRDNSCFSLCMLDLDRFKEINDTLGHSCGDKLLIEVSKRLEKSVRDCDTVSRLGGDEFAIIIRDADAFKTAVVAERISKSLKEEYVFDDEKFNISGSLGIAYYPLHGDNENVLLSCSDIAMYSAKKLNIDYVIYNEDESKIDNNKTKNNSLSLFSDLKQAIEQDQFEVHYQPKLDVKSNKITSMEAL
ncbi:diguanylate cyclase/phosphodiesterase (GGDEF & EAL domains) with PAS/PAC sensor(s), partial [hydrothermal vent metagenome]